MTYKNRKNYEILCFEVLTAGCTLLRVEGFFCNLNVLYGGIGISKLQFFIKKIFCFVFSCKFFSVFGHQSPGSRSGSVFSLKYRIRIQIGNQ
jgi:hypothetical protein